MTAPLQVRPRGVTLQLGHERVLVVPAEVALIFDRRGVHVEAVPLGFDMEALCDAQDAEDAAWFAQHRPSAQRLRRGHRAPVKPSARHRHRRRKMRR